MIFNPLFIEKSSNSGSVSVAKNPKISGASYLFNDIINVLTNSDDLGKSAKAGSAFKAFGQEFGENEGIELNLLQTAEIDLETHKSGDVKKFVKNLLALLGDNSSDEVESSDNIVVETNGQKYVVDNSKLNEMLESIIGQIKFVSNNTAKVDSNSTPITANQLVNILSENKGLVISISDADKIASFQIVNDSQAKDNELFSGDSKNNKTANGFIVKYTESKVNPADENIVAGLALAYTGNPISTSVNNIVAEPENTEDIKNNVAFYSYNHTNEQESNGINPFIAKSKLANISQMTDGEQQNKSVINKPELKAENEPKNDIAEELNSSVVSDSAVNSKDTLSEDITKQNKSVNKKLNNIGLKLNTIGEQIKETKNIYASIDNVAPSKTVETIEPLLTNDAQSEKNIVEPSVEKVDEKVNSNTTTVNTKSQTETISNTENKVLNAEDSKNIGQTTTSTVEINQPATSKQYNVKDDNPVLNNTSINVDVNKGNKNEVSPNFSTTLNDTQKKNTDNVKQNSVEKPNNFNEPLKTEKNNKEEFINKTVDILNTADTNESKEIISDLKNGEVSFKSDGKDTTLKQQNVNAPVSEDIDIENKLTDNKTIEINKENTSAPKNQNENVELSVKEEVKKNSQTLNVAAETEGGNNKEKNKVVDEIVVDKKENIETTIKSNFVVSDDNVVKESTDNAVKQKSVKIENVVDNKIPLQDENVIDEKQSVNFKEKPHVNTTQNSELPKDINVEKLIDDEPVINKESYISKAEVKTSQPEVDISNTEKSPVAGENNVKENVVDNLSKVVSTDKSFDNITPQIHNEKTIGNLNPQVKDTDTLKADISPEGNKQVNTPTDVESKQTVVEEAKPETINVKQTNDLNSVAEESDKSVVVESPKQSNVEIKSTSDTNTLKNIKSVEDVKVNNTINSTLDNDSKLSKAEIKTDVQYKPKVENNNVSIPIETEPVADNSSIPVEKPITTPENSKLPLDSFNNAEDNKKVDPVFTSKSNFNEVNNEIISENKQEPVTEAIPKAKVKEEPKLNLGNAQTPNTKVEEPVIKNATPEVSTQKVELKEEPKVNLGNIQTPNTKVEEPVIKNATPEVSTQKVELKEEPKLNLGNAQTLNTKVEEPVIKNATPEVPSQKVELKEEPKLNLGNAQTLNTKVEEPVIKNATPEVSTQKVELKEEPKVNLGNIQTPNTEVEEPVIKNESTLTSELKSIVGDKKSPDVELNLKNNDVKETREPFKVSTASKNNQSVSINTKIDSLVNKAIDKGVTTFTLHPSDTKITNQTINVNSKIDNLTENQADYSNVENITDGLTEPNLNLNSESKFEKNVVDDKKRTIDINNAQHDKKQTIDENAFVRNTNAKNNNETIVGNNTNKAKAKAEEDDPVKAENVVSVKIKRTVKNVVEGTPENRAAEPVKAESEKSTTKTSETTTKTEIKAENFTVNSESSKQSNNSSSNSESREHEESKHTVGMKIGEVENKEKKIFDDILVKQQSNEKNVKLTEVIKEVSRYIEKQEKGSLTINIEPENMGKVKISVEVNDKVVRANITVENETVKNMLESKLGDLQSNLNKNGNQNSFVNINLQEQANKNAKNNSSRGKNQKDIPVDSIEETEEAKQKSLGYNTYEYLA